MLGDEDDIAMAMGGAGGPGGAGRGGGSPNDVRRALIANVGIFVVVCLGLRVTANLLSSE